MSKIIQLHPDGPIVDPLLVEIVQNLLTRVQAGVTLGLAVVEHQIGDVVVSEICGDNSYHQINSGAARLAHQLAGMKG